MPYDEGIAGLLITLVSGVVLGLAVILLMYKIIDGDLHWAPGLCAILLVFPVLWLAIKPPHPLVPGLVLVVVITLMIFFPFAERYLEEVEMRGLNANQLAKSYAAVEARGDNYAAKFELARQLHQHGFKAQAIALTSATLSELSTDRDDVRNQSLRDVFHKEELLLKRWQGEPFQFQNFACPSCGASNPPERAFCQACGRPHLLDLIQGREVKPRVWAKLVVGFAAIAFAVPGSAAIALNLTGVMRYGGFGVALAFVGALLFWLFRPPQLQRQRPGLP